MKRDISLPEVGWVFVVPYGGGALLGGAWQSGAVVLMWCQEWWW